MRPDSPLKRAVKPHKRDIIPPITSGDPLRGGDSRESATSLDGAVGTSDTVKTAVTNVALHLDDTAQTTRLSTLASTSAVIDAVAGGDEGVGRDKIPRADGPAPVVFGLAFVAHDDLDDGWDMSVMDVSWGSVEKGDKHRYFPPSA